MFDFGNAFKLPAKRGVSPEEEALISIIAGKIKSKGLEQIALFVVDSTKPLHFIGSQAMYFIMPLMDVVLDTRQTQLFRDMLENPCAMDRLSEVLGQENSEKKSTGEDHGK